MCWLADWTSAAGGMPCVKAHAPWWAHGLSGGIMMVQAAEGGQGRLMVGLTGYPNVGKSSTINALFGSKKTAVAATPGKTKHFQTLNITERMTLCDCPGLVLPKFAASKAEMVAAGAHCPLEKSSPS